MATLTAPLLQGVLSCKTSRVFFLRLLEPFSHLALATVSSVSVCHTPTATPSFCLENGKVSIVTLPDLPSIYNQL